MEEQIDYKKRDLATILAYLEGKEQVEVCRIFEECDVEKLRVYPILMELMLDGRLKILKESTLGAPEVVRLV